MSYGYNTVTKETENIIVIERSKFICNIKPVNDESDARAFIEEIRKRHSLANHCCYAYISDDKGLVQKFSDAGEPQGTAGLPMLEVLKNKRVFKVVAVVTRYFGGIKLGTGGLTRAYGGSVSECLNKAEIVDMQQAEVISISLDYDGYSRLLKLLANPNFSILETVFDNQITVKVAVKKDFFENFNAMLLDAFNGKLSAHVLYSDYCAFR